MYGPSVYRQHRDLLLSRKDGGTPRPSQQGRGILTTQGRGEGGEPHCGTCTRSTERRRRPFISDSIGSIGVAAQQGSFPTSRFYVGTPHDRLVCARNNNLLPRFAAWTLDEQAVYVDALEHLSEKENGFAHPPFSIIGRVLRRLEESSCDLTIIVPAWPSQYWWPQLLHLLSEVPVLLHDLDNLLIPPRGTAALARRVPWRMLACRISGRSSKRGAFRRKLRRYSAIGGLRLLKEIMGYFGEDGGYSAATGEAMRSILTNLMS